jgi:hypothetical protein
MIQGHSIIGTISVEMMRRGLNIISDAQETGGQVRCAGMTAELDMLKMMGAGGCKGTTQMMWGAGDSI